MPPALFSEQLCYVRSPSKRPCDQPSPDENQQDVAMPTVHQDETDREKHDDRDHGNPDLAV